MDRWKVVINILSTYSKCMLFMVWIVGILVNVYIKNKIIKIKLNME